MIEKQEKKIEQKPTDKETQNTTSKTNMPNKNNLDEKNIINEQKDRNYTEPELVLDEFLLKNKSIEAQKYQMRKELGMALPKKEKKKTNFYRNIKVKLYKAGLEIEPEVYVRKLMFISIVILCISIFSAGVWALTQPFDWKITILLLLVSWFIGFVIIYYSSLLIALVFLDYKAFKRTKEVEKVLPEYLRLVATNYRSGLPLDKALIASNRPRFGILSKEIEQVAKTTRVKGDFAKSLEIFGKKFDSKILERAMNSISISVKSGSNISALLDEIANNITKMRNMQASMAANVKNYVIFIIVAGIIIAPLMFAMSYQMNTTIAGVKEKLDVQTGNVNMGTTMSLQSGGGVNLINFDAFAILMIITNSIVSSLVISMIRYGNFQQGIKNIFVYTLISIGLYVLGKFALSGLINFV
ncbi:MAG: type II secretion system F family protein [Candidatus Woesearchaeota archaeon]